MKFDQVYKLLLDRQTEINQLIVLLTEDTLREIYQCIVATRAKDCLELGTGFGATACVMAAAIDEIGGGTVTTVDHMDRQPVGVTHLARITGMTKYLHPVVIERGYNWFLLQMLRERTNGARCEPCFDYCYLDGAHEWEPDALAALLLPRLLRPGGWLMLDDLNYRFRGTETGPNATRAHWSNEELDTAHVGMVFDLLVTTHPDLELFMLSNTGHIGWARKVDSAPAAWLPSGALVGPVAGAWSATFDGAAIAGNAAHSDGVFIEVQESGAIMRSTVIDPCVTVATPVGPRRPIDYATLRLRLLTPDMESVQLFWIGEDDEYFHEDRSLRCIVRSSSGAQDLTFRIRGSPRARTIRMFRLDPTDGPGVMLLERLTIGSW